MVGFEPLSTWISLYDYATTINEYEELRQKFFSLQNKVLSKKSLSDEDEKEFQWILLTHWRWIIRDKCQELDTRINSRKTKGQNFTENDKKIKDIRVKGEEELEISDYDDLFNELKWIEKDIDEKISIENFDSQQLKKGLLYGGIIGFVLGIIGSLILNCFGM